MNPEPVDLTATGPPFNKGRGFGHFYMESPSQRCHPMNRPSATDELPDRYFEPIAPLREPGPGNIFINGAETVFHEKSGNPAIKSATMR